MDRNNDKFITVLTFTYSHELAVVRGRLESEGIVCNAQDEVTAQVNPLYSNAIGGIKLQVKESDLERAVEILKESGYLHEGDLQPPLFITGLVKYIAQFPLLKNLRLEIRLPLIVALAVLLVAGIIYFVSYVAICFLS